MKCRICASENLIQIFNNTNCPKTSHKYLTAQELDGDYRVTVRVLECLECKTVQIMDAYPGEEYVSDYQRNISFSKSALSHMKEMAEALAGQGVTNVVEIGCGNGTFSRLLQSSRENGKIKVTAFEPSKAAYKAAKESGIDVHNVFFDKFLPEEFSDFDGFALRFVLEHLDDPKGILNEIKNRCREGAAGLIEVPNAQKQFIENRWFDFFPEHILYFTPTTLRTALERFGFNVLWIKTTTQDEFLVAVVKIPGEKKESPPAKITEDTSTHIPESLPKEMLEKFCRLANGLTYVWGASGGATTFLSSIPADIFDSKNIKYIVDSDSNKWNLYASGSKLKIVPPEEVVKNPPETIIIMAMSYEKEIREQLGALGYSGKIRSLAECLKN